MITTFLVFSWIVMAIAGVCSVMNLYIILSSFPDNNKEGESRKQLTWSTIIFLVGMYLVQYFHNHPVLQT